MVNTAAMRHERSGVYHGPDVSNYREVGCGHLGLAASVSLIVALCQEDLEKFYLYLEQYGITDEFGKFVQVFPVFTLVRFGSETLFFAGLHSSQRPSQLC